LRMDANQWRGFAFQIAANKRHGFFLRTVSGEAVNREISPARGRSACATCLSARFLAGFVFVRDFVAIGIA